MCWCEFVYSLDVSELVSQEVKVLDPEDTSWIDQSMMTETDDAVHVKVVERRQAKSTARHTNTDRMDFDVEVRPLP